MLDPRGHVDPGTSKLVMVKVLALAEVHEPILRLVVLRGHLHRNHQRQNNVSAVT